MRINTRAQHNMIWIRLYEWIILPLAKVTDGWYVGWHYHDEYNVFTFILKFVSTHKGTYKCPKAKLIIIVLDLNVMCISGKACALCYERLNPKINNVSGTHV